MIDTVAYYREIGLRAIQTLIKLECKKCSKCEKWMDKQFIDKENTCEECTLKQGAQMRQNIGWLPILVMFVFGVSCAYAGGVTDDNNGNAGYIFVSTGENHGADSVGHWTDPTSISGLKGAKGDKGDTGATGAQGIQGIQGATGTQGVAGTDGIDGKDGAQGIQGDIGATGTQGDKGDQGLQGIQGFNGKDVDPATVNNLQQADASLNNRLNDTNSRVDNLDRRVHRLEETKYLFETVVRLTDTRKTRLEIFDSYDVRHSSNFAIGVRFTYKIGLSYEERMIEKTNKRVDAIEARLGNAPVIEKVVDTNGNVKSLHISQNGLQVDGRF